MEQNNITKFESVPAPQSPQKHYSFVEAPIARGANLVQQRANKKYFVNRRFGNSANTCSKMLKSLFPWKHNKTKQVMAAQPPMDEELIIQEANLLPCHVCGRTFLANPLKKHAKICERNAVKKRKPFDSLKQRVAGTDLADFHQPTYLKKKEEPMVETNQQQSKWKEKHLELVSAIRAAKGVPADRMVSSPTPKPRSTTSFAASSAAANERCPSCDRHFGHKAFDRHVEWCKERKARIQQSPASVQQAKERLEARIKYRVPPLNKSKRMLIREKYSNPHSPEPVCTTTSSSTANLVGALSRTPSIRKPKSLINVEKSSDKLHKSDVEKCDGDKKRNSTEGDRKMSLSFGLPVIGSPSPKAESVKSLQNKRNPITPKKLNSTSINSLVGGMMVSSMTQLEVNRRMVTWKDTIKKGIGTPEKYSLGTDQANMEIRHTEMNSTEYSKLQKIGKKNTGKILIKEYDKNLTSSYSEIDVDTQDIENSSISSRNMKHPRKLTKEKTFCLEKPVQIKDINLPSKRRRDRHLDLNVAATKTKSEVVPTEDASKTDLEKILSSNDVLYKNKLTRIPTKRNFKNLSDVLKRYKKLPDNNAVGGPSLEKNVKEESNYHVIEDKVAKTDKSKLTKNAIGDSGNCPKAEKVNCKEKSEKEQILDINLDEISKSIRCFEGLNDGKLNFYENLKGINEFSHSLKDEDEDIDKYTTDHTTTTNDHTNMDKWFEENFIGESEDQYLKIAPDSKCENSPNILNGLDKNYQNCQEELEGTSDKDSLEDASIKCNKCHDACENVPPLSNKEVDCPSFLSFAQDKNDDNYTVQNKFTFPLKLKPNTNSVDTTPSTTLDKSTKVVYLFQSGTNLDLTRDNSQNTLTDKTSWSSVSTTNFEKELHEISNETLLKDSTSSNFSLRKSFSDINVLINKSLSTFCERDYSEDTVIPLFLKRRFVFESESVDFRKTYEDIRLVSSVPIVHLSSFKVKKNRSSVKDASERNNVVLPFSQFEFPFGGNRGRAENVGEEKKVNWGDVGSKERLEILRVAAEKFIEETKKTKSKEFMSISVLEEDYSVPKKKRRVYQSDESETNIGEISEDCHVLDRENAAEWSASDSKANATGDGRQKNCEGNVKEVQKIKVCVQDDGKTSCREGETVPSSAASSAMSEIITPRTLNLIQKIVKGKKLKAEHSNVLLALSVSECEKLLEIDKNCLSKVEKQIEKRTDGERVKFPLIIGDTKIDGKVDRNVQVRLGNRKEVFVKLPSICRMGRLSEEGTSSDKSQVVKCKNEQKHLKNQSNTSNYDPFEIAQRQFMELLECDDFKPFTPSHSSPPTRPHTTVPTPLKTPTTPVPVKKTVKSADTDKKGGKRQSVIDPPLNFKDSLDSATDNDEFELIENMINERFGDETNGFYMHNLTRDNNSLTLDKILDNRKYSDDMSSASIDPRLINENDNLSIPEHFKIDDYSPTSTIDTEITLQNDDVDPYSVQYDSKIEAIEPRIEKKPLVKRSLSLVNRSSKRDASNVTTGGSKISSNHNNSSAKKGAITGNKIVTNKCSKSHVSASSAQQSGRNEDKVRKSEKKKGLPLLKRSTTLFDPSPKPSFKNKQEVNDYFNGNELKTMSSSMTMTNMTSHNMEKNITDTPSIADSPKAEELFAVDDEMYEEYKKYEEMYLKEKEQNSNSNKKNKNKNMDLNYGLLTASEEEDHSNQFNNKLSNDSAYGSLRKTSKHRSRAPKLSPLEPKHVESTSSSGSENGLSSPAPPSGGPKVSKFCHECGTKFPVTAAKFCVECGVKRLVL